MNASRLTVAAVAACILAAIAMAPEGVAQLGGSPPATFQTVEAGAFLLKDEDGEIVGGLTTGPGLLDLTDPNTAKALRGSPVLFLRQDSLQVAVFFIGSTANLQVGHKSGPNTTLAASSWGAEVKVEDDPFGRKNRVRIDAGDLGRLGSGNAEIEISTRDRNGKMQHTKVLADIEGLQMERELLDRHRFATQSQAQLTVFEYLEGWYNPHRRHSALGQRSPINYERFHFSKGINPNGKLSVKSG